MSWLLHTWLPDRLRLSVYCQAPGLLSVPKTSKKSAYCGAFDALVVSYNLPGGDRQSVSNETFKSKLKTHLFTVTAGYFTSMASGLVPVSWQ